MISEKKERSDTSDISISEWLDASDLCVFQWSDASNLSVSQWSDASTLLMCLAFVFRSVWTNLTHQSSRIVWPMRNRKA